MKRFVWDGRIQLIDKLQKYVTEFFSFFIVFLQRMLAHEFMNCFKELLTKKIKEKKEKKKVYLGGLYLFLISEKIY